MINLYNSENNLPLIDNSQKISYLVDIYHLNLLVYKLYKLYKNNNITKKKKIKIISKFTDSSGNYFLTKKKAKYLYNKYARNIFIFYEKINKLKNNYNYNMIGSSTKKNNKFSIYNHVNNLFGWIFFPLFNIEKKLGMYATIPLDIIGIMLESSSLITEPLSLGTGPTIQTVFAASTAGLGGVAAPIVAAAEKPISYVVANFGAISNLWINIARKKWEPAYENALQSFPGLEKFTSVFLNNSERINKAISAANCVIPQIANKIKYVDKHFSSYKPVITKVLLNPSLLDNEQSYNELIQNNKKKIPSLKHLSLDEIKNKSKNPYIIFNPFNVVIYPYQVLENIILNRKNYS